MGRIADDAATRSVRKGPVCSIGTLLASMDDEDREDLLTLLASDTPGTVIAATLEKFFGTTAPRGHSVNNHRASRCACGRG